MTKSEIEILRAEVARLAREIAELKFQKQQATLDAGLPIGESEKGEFSRAKQEWELAEIERMQQIASENPSTKVGWMFDKKKEQQ